MSDTTPRGRFVWHELMTTNTKSAADFFSRVASWTPQPWGEDRSYTLFMAGGRSMAGLMALPESARAMGASDELTDSLRRLPEGTFDHLEAVWEALGGRVEYRA